MKTASASPASVRRAMCHGFGELFRNLATRRGGHHRPLPLPAEATRAGAPACI